MCYYRGMLGAFIGLVTGREEKKRKIIMKELGQYDFEKEFKIIGKAKKKWGKIHSKVSMFGMMTSPKAVSLYLYLMSTLVEFTQIFITEAHLI
jgi:hypothetical protein